MVGDGTQIDVWSDNWLPTNLVKLLGCLYRSSWCLLDRCEASPVVVPVLVRWSVQTLDRSLPVRMISRSPQGQGSFGREAAAAAVGLRLVSMMDSIVCWSKDLFVICFTAEVFCTADVSSI